MQGDNGANSAKWTSKGKGEGKSFRSSPSRSLSSWLERFATLEAYVSLEGRHCCYLSAIDATTRFPLAFFFGRENRKGWKSFERGTKVIFFFFFFGEGRKSVEKFDGSWNDLV